MSTSIRYLSQQDTLDHPIPPLSRNHNDFGEEYGILQKKDDQQGEISLVDQILEFLDNYPSCFARPAAFSSQMYSC